MRPEFCEFDRFRVDVVRRSQYRDGEPVSLSPKVFDTLLEFIRRGGRVTTKDELMSAVWPDANVEENSLARNVSLLARPWARAMSGPGHRPPLWKVASGGGRAAQLNDKLRLRPAISRDGQWIAGFYADRRLNTQKEPASIAVIRAGGGEPSKVFPIPSPVSVPAGIRWSRDGRELAYVDNRGGGAPHQLTQFHGDILLSFDWSRDGRHLAFSRGVQERDVALIEDTR